MSARDKLKAELEAYCSTDGVIDPAMMKDVIEEASGFEADGKRKSFGLDDIFVTKQDGSYKISDKWIGNALGSLRKLVEAGQKE